MTITSLSRHSAALPVGLLCIATTASLATSHPMQDPCVGLTEYESLTNSYRTATNYNVETTRGMAETPSGLLLFINTHGSTLNLHVPGGPVEPDFVWGTIHNPVAVGVWADTVPAPKGEEQEEGDGEPTVTEYALVLGAGTHALVRHELNMGRIDRLLQFSAEPGDLVVDSENDRAFVSLPGSNEVVQIDLNSFSVVKTFSVASERPRFLSLDDDGTALVAAELSTNNSIADAYINEMIGGLPPDYARARDLSDQPSGGLPDFDLFRIDPAASGSNPVALEVLRGAGTLLMAHGRNPATGDYWIVGTDSLNTADDGVVGSLEQSIGTTEPKLNGQFAQNILSIASALGTGSGGLPPSPTTVIDLDVVSSFNGSTGTCTTSTTYAATHNCSFPYALAFTGTGFGAITASTGDRVRIVTSGGCRVGDLELPDGAIPRDLMFSLGDVLLYVYCWGTNQVLVYDVNVVASAMGSATNQVVPSSTGLIATVELGADPVSDEVKRGRQLFYDGDNSANARFTCAHCHPGGGMDLIGWNIAGFPHDHKDMMVTQSLKSIEDTFPYHWRGEQDLEAFNGAFANLLGGTRLTEDLTDPDIVAAGLSTDTDGIDRNEPSQFEDFKAFVFSLQSHANPRQSRCRRIDPAFVSFQESLSPFFSWPASADPADGQTLTNLDNTLLNRFSCVECHANNTGTIGDTQQDDPFGNVAANRVLDIAHFRELRHKNQPLVSLTLDALGATVTGDVARNGFGLSHDGNDPSVFDFLTFGFDFTPGVGTGVTPTDVQRAANVAAYVEQADAGITPAAHLAYRIAGPISMARKDTIEAHLVDQEGGLLTADHWTSIAVIGSFDDGAGGRQDLRLYGIHDPGHLFAANDPSFMFQSGTTGVISWDDLVLEAAALRADFVILGLPPGNGYRFAVDRDNDLLPDLAEAGQGGDIDVADTDGDGFPDGHEWLNGGDVDDSGVVSADSTAPTVVTSRIDHMGASYAKLVLRYSEPCTVEITATDSVSGHTVVERRFSPRYIDTVTVQRLLPSVPAITIGPSMSNPLVIAQQDTNYTFEIVVTDLGGNPSVAPQAQETGATADHTMLNPLGLNVVDPPAGDVLPPLLIPRILSSMSFHDSSPTSSGGGMNFLANAQVETRLDDTLLAPFYTNNAAALEPDNALDEQVVVAQVLRYDAVNDEWTALRTSGGAYNISGPAGTVFTDIALEGLFSPGGSNGNLLEEVIGVSPPDPLSPAVVLPAERGDFVISTTSGLSGAVSFDFTVTPALPSGDRIKLNVVAILERDTRVGATGAPGSFFWFSVGNWDKPATPTEARAAEVEIP